MKYVGTELDDVGNAVREDMNRWIADRLTAEAQALEAAAEAFVARTGRWPEYGWIHEGVARVGDVTPKIPGGCVVTCFGELNRNPAEA